MSWTCYQLAYRLESPLHIGFHEAGYIQRTRKYVPGRAMWGAITARLTRLLYTEAGAQAYQEIGKKVNENLIPGYFFIGDPVPLLPQYAEGRGLIFARPDQNPEMEFTEAEFERRFLCSFTQTSIRGKTQTAEEESLHEMEFLVHRYKHAKDQPVLPTYLVGHLFLKDGTTIETSANGSGSTKIASEEDLKKYLAELTIGGERAYGCGRVVLEGEPTKTDKLFDWEFVGSEERPVVRKALEGSLRAHAARDCQRVIAGDLERFAFRSWSADAKKGGVGPGRLVEQVKNSVACWVPGSTAAPDASAAEVSFAISDYGIWQPIGGERHA